MNIPFLNKKKTKIFEFSQQKFENTFNKMKAEAGWDTSGKLKWGFYFLDSNEKKLKNFSEKLIQTTLKIVELRPIPHSNLFLLHVEENTIHSPESFFKRCQSLTKVANEYNIEIFDGWDVGR